jgi:N utilization substance protein B
MNSDAAAKSRTRKFLVQAMYQALLTDESFNDVTEPFIKDHNMKRADLEYFRDAMNGVEANRSELRQLITGKLDRSYEALDPIEETILLLGCYELQSRIEVPFRVVINEGIELAKSFGATDSYRYVNSILDSLAKDLRPHG